MMTVNFHMRQPKSMRDMPKMTSGKPTALFELLRNAIQSLIEVIKGSLLRRRSKAMRGGFA
jgi:hypothetical protein